MVGRAKSVLQYGDLAPSGRVLGPFCSRLEASGRPPNLLLSTTAFDATAFSSEHNSGRADSRPRDIAFASRSSDQQKSREALAQ
jgi:hypothetical protein